MKLFYYWLLLAFIFFAFCKKNAQNNVKSDTNYPDTLNIAPKTPILWSNLCSIKEFEIISDCKIKSRYNEYYEVKLTQDPFKPLILISIFFDKNNIAELYLTEIKLSPEHSKNHETKYSNLLQIELTSNPHAVYCYYNSPKKIEIQKTNTKGKTEKLKKFFTQDLWQMSNNDPKSTLFDPETCSIKATKGNAEKTIYRQSGEDEAFYSHIQLLLDVAGVKDYSYGKRK